MKIIVCGVEVRTLKWHRIDMMRAFMARGYEVVAMADGSEKEWAPFFAKMGIRYRHYYVVRNGTNPLQDLKTLSELKRIFSEEKPDKVFVYHAKANIYGLLAAKSIGIKDAYAMVGGLGSVFNGRGIKKTILRRILTSEYRRAFTCAKVIFFQNNDDLQYCISRRMIVQSKTVLIPGSGVNTDLFPYSEPRPPTSFLFAGRLLKDKGLFEYLEAAKMVKKLHPEVEFKVVGSFDSNPSACTPEELNAYVENGSVVYCGETDDMKTFLAECSVFVLPSYREGTPKVALEALSVGRPVILTDVPGCRGVIVDGQNGLLVHPRDALSVAKAIMFFINNPHMVSQMGRSGRRLATTHFNVKNVNKIICNHVFNG